MNYGPNAMQPQGAVEARQPEIVTAMNALNNDIDGLNVLIGALIDRLGPILTPANPADCPVKEPSFQCALAKSIYSSAQRVREVSRYVQDTMGRVEL